MIRGISGCCWREANDEVYQDVVVGEKQMTRIISGCCWREANDKRYIRMLLERSK